MTLPELVILDRDGVINADSPDYVTCAQQWQPLPGALEAMARLHACGIRVAVATNQSGIARGLFDETTLAEIHERMQRELGRAGGELAMIEWCPHGPDDGCSCRKPAPGLLLRICEAQRVAPAAVPFIGDSRRDLEAALAAGCRPMLVRTGNGVRTEAELEALDVAIYDDLADCVQHLLSEDGA